ncbi:MAG: biotin--[acetyl-CoA-carboxylase] ligase [Planctomycetota bacterium]
MKSPSAPPLDGPTVHAKTGWCVEHQPVVTSTHDIAAARLRAGASPPLVVVADEQTAGRGREGRRFHSPPGGLYASLLVAASPLVEPAPLVAAAAVAVAEALEALGARDVEIKWPNDVWIGGRKVSGILLERVEGGERALVGIGINLARVPLELPADVARRTTCVADALGRVPSRTEVLIELLPRLDARMGDACDPARTGRLEDGWRARLALRGQMVRFRQAGQARAGVLEDASFTEGLLVRDGSGPRWRPAAHVVDLTPA